MTVKNFKHDKKVNNNKNNMFLLLFCGVSIPILLLTFLVFRFNFVNSSAENANISSNVVEKPNYDNEKIIHSELGSKKDLDYVNKETNNSSLKADSSLLISDVNTDSENKKSVENDLKESSKVEEPKEDKSKARTLVLNQNTVINWYPEIGQAGINADHSVATTWGGDFDPNKPTLIAGHDDGPMGELLKLKVGDKITLYDQEGKIHNYKLEKTREIEMVFDGQGSGFVKKEADDNYLVDVLDHGNYLNLQVCIDYNSKGYSILIASFIHE
jgi:hypothetical protein